MSSRETLLPLQQRYHNGFPIPHSRTTLKSTERYIVYLIFLIFMSLCYSAVFLLPDLRERMNTYVDSPENLFGPPVLLPNDGGKGFIVVNHNDGEDDIHAVNDRNKLNLQIRQDKALEEARNALNRPPASVINDIPNKGKDIINEGKDNRVYENEHKNDEDHQKVRDEINQDKAKFLEQQVMEEEERKEEARQKARKDMEDRGFILQSDGEPEDETTRERRTKIREMMLHAWTGYETYAWGANELKPITRQGHSAGIFGRSSMGATIVDGIDTLYIMGLTDQYHKARNWIAHDFKFNPTSDISVFEVNIRYIGGLISMYALSKDEIFKEKALEIAEKLLPAFNSPTGIPYGQINIRTGSVKNWGWASGGCSILSELGSLQLEFSYLTEISGNRKFVDKVDKVREILRNVDKIDGLYPNYLHPKTGKWGQKHVSLGALGDSYYEYLLKSYIQTDGKDEQGLAMYLDAVEAMERKMKQTSSSGLIYFGDFRGAKVDKKMDHLSCFSGGMFALGSKYAKDPDHHLEVGKQLTETCHKAYDNTPTKLGPEAFRFEGHAEAVAMRQNEKYYILRPETIESYFVLWRITKDPKYREWGWEAAQAIEKNCRVEAGYSGIRDVYASKLTHDDVQQSFFLAETLKYLYLLFSEDDLISLDEWVFNTEAHPLPISRNAR